MEDDSSTRKRKLPAGKACKACRGRKHRCNGGRPQCSNCSLRGVPCEYPYVPADELSIEELRSVMEAKLRENIETKQPEPTVSRPVDEDSGLAALPRTSAKVSDNINAMTPASNPLSVPATTATTTKQHSTATLSASESTSPEPEGYFGESSTFSFVSKVQPRPLLSSPQDRHKRRRLSSSRSAKTAWLEDIGLSPPQGSDDCYELPSKQLADGLLDAYFARVHRLYPYVHEPTFRLDYERMYMLRDSKSLALARPAWCGLLNMIFAHGAEFCDLVPEQDSVATASLFVNKARRIIFSHVFKDTRLELVQGLLLLCQYLQSTLALNECWNLVGLLIRSAIGLGLHLNPPRSGSMSCLEREFRIRTWWGCFIIDRTLSMKFGRPPTIDHASAFDVDLPLEVDDLYISQESVAPRQPEGQHSLIVFFSRTIRIVEVMGRVLGELYHPSRETSRRRSDSLSICNATHLYIISRTVQLDGDLVSVWDQTPAYLKEQPSTPDSPAIELQRNVLLTRYISLRLLIHRQTFLIFSKYNIDDPFHRAVAIASCRVCLDTARQSIEIVHEHHHRRMLNSLWYSLHYVFTAMGVLLSLQTMDKARLDAIGETGQDDKALELGMEFLESASKISTLAARYVAMLKRIWTGSRLDGRDEKRMSIAWLQRESPSLPNTADQMAASQAFPTPETIWPVGALDDFPILNDMIDFSNDLLYGTGLPRDLVSTDWSTFGLSF